MMKYKDKIGIIANAIDECRYVNSENLDFVAKHILTSLNKDKIGIIASALIDSLHIGTGSSKFAAKHILNKLREFEEEGDK